MNREDALKMSDNALQDLAQALKEGKSDKLVEYLGMLSRFHQYSFGNCIMIYMQRPDATFVAGFGRWKELNRFVKKGEIRRWKDNHLCQATKATDVFNHGARART